MLKNLLYHLKRPYHFVKTGLLNGLVAEIRYFFPARKITIFAITGTDGKTTSSTMLYHILQHAGYKVALLSTVAAYLGDEEIDTGFHVTSPQPRDLHHFMRKMVDNGYTHLVLEVTSHGMYQYRTWGITPKIAGITNVDREHLDYHVTYQNYLAAKGELLKKAEIAIGNADNRSFHRLKKYLGSKKLIPYSADMEIPSKVSAVIKNRFAEAYNQMNARLVYTILKQIDFSDQAFIEAIPLFPGIPGRMETITIKKPYTVIVDFAHTPQGLESALTAIRKAHPKQKIISIVGCAGLRDFAKRPLMGEIATRLSDVAIFTAEDPRTENVWSIIRQMKENLTEHHNKIISIADRGEAIMYAMNTLAQKNDIIVVFGKGHEKSMCYGTVEYLWNDKEAVLAIAKGEVRYSNPDKREDDHETT